MKSSLLNHSKQVFACLSLPVWLLLFVYWRLPPGVDLQHISSSLSGEGVLLVEAPLPGSATTILPSDMVIPILIKHEQEGKEWIQLSRCWDPSQLDIKLGVKLRSEWQCWQLLTKMWLCIRSWSFKMTNIVASIAVETYNLIYSHCNHKVVRFFYAFWLIMSHDLTSKIKINRNNQDCWNVLSHLSNYRFIGSKQYHA